MPYRPTRLLTAAEQVVDFPAHDTHIAEQRQRLERAVQPSVKRAAYLIVELYGYPPLAVEAQIARRFERELDRTLSFGFREAQREVRELRRRSSLKAYSVPDVGQYAGLARRGKDAVRMLVGVRARTAARGIVDASIARAGRTPERHTRMLLLAAVADQAARSAHNYVLELIGETLNLGRTAGALSLDNPPEYAMRSEELDERTCDECESQHGEIYMVDSPDYNANLPPEGCLGGGRCRGIMVFGDGPSDVRQPEPSPERLALLREAA